MVFEDLLANAEKIKVTSPKLINISLLQRNTNDIQ